MRKIRPKGGFNTGMLGVGIFKRYPIPGSMPDALRGTTTLADLGLRTSKSSKRRSEV